MERLHLARNSQRTGLDSYSGPVRFSPIADPAEHLERLILCAAKSDLYRMVRSQDVGPDDIVWTLVTPAWAPVAVFPLPLEHGQGATCALLAGEANASGSWWASSILLGLMGRAA